jgi:anthranilate synthase component I
MTSNLIATAVAHSLDTETPVSIFLKLREHFHQCIMLESVDKQTSNDRHSFICFEPMAEITITDLTIRTSFFSKPPTETTCRAYDEILPQVIKFFESFTFSNLPEDQTGLGLYGYCSYEAIKYFENITVSDHKSKIPEMQFTLYRYVLSIDHLKNETTLITVRQSQEEELQEARIFSILRNSNIPSYPFRTTSDEIRNQTDEEYLQAVKKGINHCAIGDVFQVVLSIGYQQQFFGDDFNIYRALRIINPSPYLFYFDYGHFRLFGSSPEAQLRMDSNTASIHPIAGTYRRTGNKSEDELSAELLKDDEKENAEHVMLVDLARNDLSKNFKDVHVADYRQLEKYSHVMHLVSKVVALNPVMKTHPLKVLADSFPAGTLTGAPKYKAMNIISETEPTPREYYGGCLGMIGFDGKMNTAIMIRSFLSMQNVLHYQAGAGVTINSIPESELQEVNNKIAALRNSIFRANNN